MSCFSVIAAFIESLGIKLFISNIIVNMELDLEDKFKIKDGGFIILVDNSGNRRIVKCKGKQKFKHFKAFVDPQYLIGHPYGTFFEVKDQKTGQLVPIYDFQKV